MIECYTCRGDVRLAHHVKLRGDVTPRWGPGSPPSEAAWEAYLEDTTYRSAFVCMGCYAILDNDLGLAEFAGREYSIAGVSRRGKAPVWDRAKVDSFRRRQAQRLGLPEF